MPWQDVVLTICIFITAGSLLPSIFSKDKPSIWTSLINTVILYVIVYVNFSLELYGASLGVFVAGTLWMILLIQKFRTITKQSK